MYKDKMEEARARMVHGIGEFSRGLADLVNAAILSHISVVSIPALSSSYAVRRAPCIIGRVSQT